MGLGDYPETFLLKALCCQSAPSCVKVMGGGGGGWWPMRFYCHLLGLGLLSILYSIPRSQVPETAPSWLKVRGGGGGWCPMRFYCHLLGLGLLSILYSPFYSQVPGPKSQSQSLENLENLSTSVPNLYKRSFYQPKQLGFYIDFAFLVKNIDRRSGPCPSLHHLYE